MGRAPGHFAWDLQRRQVARLAVDFVKDVKFAPRQAQRDFDLYSLCYYATRSRAKGQVRDRPKAGTIKGVGQIDGL
jgi:hypothetical protein